MSFEGGKIFLFLKMVMESVYECVFFFFIIIILRLFDVFENVFEELKKKIWNLFLIGISKKW